MSRLQRCRRSDGHPIKQIDQSTQCGFSAVVTVVDTSEAGSNTTHERSSCAVVETVRFS